jgi:hypothetical protein
MAARPNDGLSQGTQGHWWEVLSPTQVLTGTQPQTVKKKRKCHGNQKLQHFKRKCRIRGLNEKAIIALIHARNQTLSEQLLNGQINEQTKQSKKRKRDISQQDLMNSSVKSLSQLSISQEARKKLKTVTEDTMSIDSDSSHSNQDTYTLYKPSKYLKMPRKLLLHALRLQLNYTLQKKKEQHFILSRLQIVDQQFCLEQMRYLYQIYFDLGAKYQIWPVRITKFVLSMYIVIFDYFIG